MKNFFCFKNTPFYNAGCVESLFYSGYDDKQKVEEYFQDESIHFTVCETSKGFSNMLKLKYKFFLFSNNKTDIN